MYVMLCHAIYSPTRFGLPQLLSGRTKRKEGHAWKHKYISSLKQVNNAVKSQYFE